ncbi:conserved hypothetical protein [Bacillus cereus E33L]|uniref:GrpB family protein n=1 Tax=Bacillus cereus (strain ZK / E33L) TaxID=288681 RepID=Q637V4_BACCZ|nr:conserved hypothetical protein [Bacillus cereus E33L]
MKQRITIEEYNIKWESEFNKLQTLINDVMEGSTLSIEHVGSTSIKGLAAKPVLDIDIVIEDYEIFPKVVTKLEAIGYYHQAERTLSFRGMEKVQIGWNIICMCVIKKVKS